VSFFFWVCDIVYRNIYAADCGIPLNAIYLHHHHLRLQNLESIKTKYSSLKIAMPHSPRTLISFRRCLALPLSLYLLKTSATHCPATWNPLQVKTIILHLPFILAVTTNSTRSKMSTRPCPPFKNTSKHLIIANYNLVYNYLIGNEEINFHTYLPINLKPYALFISHLHTSTTVEDIQASLIDMGHDVIRVCNIQHRITKTYTFAFISY